ncbi:MAG: hypothetical protein C0434_08075 [Xanthomonadaceae bacterium]|nr:hypothetical protein [Xanthomonadaceae bacterium]
MKISIPVFRGRAPRVSPRALAEGYAQVAQSARLLSGDLESWRERNVSLQLAKGGTVNTIHRMASRTGDMTPFWLHWLPGELAPGETNVDVALGPEPADTDVATYFTGTTMGPRYTTKFLATDPSQRGTAAVGAYPYASRSLGISPPTAPPTVTQELPVIPANSVSYYESGASNANWSTVKTGGDYANFYQVTDPAFQSGAPTSSLVAPYYALQWQSGGGALAIWNEAYRLGEANELTFSVNVDTAPDGVGAGSSEEGNGSIVILAADTGVGPRINLNFRSPGNAQYIDAAGGAAPVTIPGVTLNGNTPVKVIVTGTKQAPVTGSSVVKWKINIEIRNYATNALLGSLSDQTATVAGDVIAFIGTSGSQNNATFLFFNDVNLTTILAPDAGPAPVFTTYVYTLVNDLGWESAPSFPSEAVTVDNGIINTVTLPLQTQPNIVAARIYRASVNTTEAVYRLLAEVPAPLPYQFVDDKLSAEVQNGSVLDTVDYDVPPAGLRGLLALPGGALVGFVGNELCFSEPGEPYAWPVKYRLPTDFNIVGIAAINSIVVVLTEAFAYLAAGNLPGDYVMERLEYPQGCVSKRSVAYLSGAGVLYASPDGLFSITGSGPPRNVTEQLFTRREWQELNPASIIAAAHDDRYFAFYQKPDGTKGGFVLDFRDGGFGMIDLPDHATSVFADPLTDALYFTADDAYPTPAKTGATLLEWDAATTRRPYTWRSKLYLNPYPTAWMAAQVRAQDYDSLALRIIRDGGVLLYQKVVTGRDEFLLPAFPQYSTEIELVGTSRVQAVEIAEDMDELS